MLERGDFLPRERDNWNSRAVFGDAKYTADETFYDVHDRPFQPELHYYVGGNSKVYGAALFRLLPAEFGEVRHPNGVAPAWPLSYQDMEPYYVRAEHLFWVHGKHGEDPFAGISSRDYRYPPVQHEPRIQQLSDDLDKLGLHPFHLPLGVQLTQDAHGRATADSRCIRCDRVDGFRCLIGGKADAEWAVIRPALAAHPNLELMTRTTAERLLTDTGGRSVTGVAVTLPDGSPHAFTAVLDVHCKAHDLDNLYVADGGFMPSIGAVNPTLTIIANALRVGDHIAERIGTTRHPEPGIVSVQSPPTP